jgi:hypothetical protein
LRRINSFLCAPILYRFLPRQEEMETTSATDAPARKKKGLTGSLKAIIGLPSTRKTVHRRHSDGVSEVKSETQQPRSVANIAVIEENPPGVLTRNITTTTQSNLDVYPGEQTKNLQVSTTQSETRDSNRILTDLEASSTPSSALSAVRETSESWTDGLKAVSESWWDKAYEDIRTRHRRLVNRYETILSSRLDTTTSNEMKSAEAKYKEVVSSLKNPDSCSIGKSQMKTLLESWLLKADEDAGNSTFGSGDDSGDQSKPVNEVHSEQNSIEPGIISEMTRKPAADRPSSFLRGILREAVNAVSPGAEVAWVAICYGSKVQ